jgi:N-acetylated-alpha-linked acidic dipeptidase
VATLKEDPVPQDPTSDRPDIVPTFVGYSPSGNVTAETVPAASRCNATNAER